MKLQPVYLCVYSIGDLLPSEVLAIEELLQKRLKESSFDREIVVKTVNPEELTAEENCYRIAVTTLSPGRALNAYGANFLLSCGTINLGSDPFFGYGGITEKRGHIRFSMDCKPVSDHKKTKATLNDLIKDIKKHYHIKEISSFDRFWTGLANGFRSVFGSEQEIPLQSSPSAPSNEEPSSSSRLVQPQPPLAEPVSYSSPYLTAQPSVDGSNVSETPGMRP